MKCQNCGRKDINFHYSSNINGCVTETHLCAECAEKSGYDIGRLFDTGSIFNDFFPMISGFGGFIPVTMPVMSLSRGFPFVLQPDMRRLIKAGTRDHSCETKTAEAQTAEVDDVMKKRRELNIQMRIAAENEEFEKAAGIRDKIKELEK